ncbi:MAG: hypothetical protein ABIO82_07920 [Ginsengibacter sp.]
MQRVIQRKFPAIFLLLFLISSCRVTLVPEYNARLETQITDAAKATDRLYIDLLGEELSARNYDRIQARYNDLEAEINSIELINQGRVKNDDFLAIIKNLKDAFHEAKEYHKEHKTLSNGEIKAYQATLAGYWKPLYVAERSLK